MNHIVGRKGMVTRMDMGVKMSKAMGIGMRTSTGVRQPRNRPEHAHDSGYEPGMDTKGGGPRPRAPPPPLPLF